MDNQQLQPSALFNFVDALDENNPALRTVVIDSKGMPKPLVGVSVVKDTTYQVYDPAGGDIILQADLPVIDNEGEWSPVTINIISVDGITEDVIEDVVDDTVIHATMDYLNNPDPTVRYYTLDSVTDTVRGDSLTAMVDRRRKLAELFSGCEPSIRDSLVNWLDNDQNADNVEAMNLSWVGKPGLPYRPSISYSYTKIVTEENEERDTTRTTSVLTWVKSDDDDGVTVIYHSLNGIQGMLNTRTLQMNVHESVDVTDDIIKMMVLTTVDDDISTIKMYVTGNMPLALLPTRPYSLDEDVECSEFNEHLSRSGIDDVTWDGLTHEEKFVMTNTLGWNVPYYAATPDDLIDVLFNTMFGEGDAIHKSAVKVFSSEDGNTHTLIIPPYKDILENTSVVAYISKEPMHVDYDIESMYTETVNDISSEEPKADSIEDADTSDQSIEEDSSAPKSRTITIKPQHNTYTTPVLTADK